MNPRNKFLFGAGIIVGSVGFLIASGVKETGVYFLTPTELFKKVEPIRPSTTSASRWAPRWCPARSAATTPRAGRLRGHRRRASSSRSPTRASCPTPSPTPATSRWSSRGSTAATACSTPPTCWPSAARGTRPSSRRRRRPDVTLLGQFALWLGPDRRPLGRRALVRRPLAGPARPGAHVHRVQLRALRAPCSSRRCRSGRGSSRTTSTSSTSGPTPRATCPTPTSSRRSGPARRARCSSGRWCSRSSARWRRS